LGRIGLLVEQVQRRKLIIWTKIEVSVRHCYFLNIGELSKLCWKLIFDVMILRGGDFGEMIKS
jgi:hypothetical protein